MASRMRNNPWADPKETQRWVHRKIEDSGTRLPHLSTCEWMTTIIVTFIVSAQLYSERAVMVTALIGTSEQFGWNTLADVTLVACFYLGYLSSQIPAGYLSDNRLSVLGSVSGIDQITGEVVLTSPVETTIGAMFFGDGGETKQLEVDYGEVQLDSLMQPTDVVADGARNANSKTDKKWKRLKHLRKQLGSQYSKYGARWLITLTFIVWGLLAMIFGITVNVNSDPTLIYVFMIFRFLTGICDGIILVSIQGLIAKEVPPLHRVAASSFIGISMPIGSLMGTCIRFFYLAGKTTKSKAHVDVITWIGASSLIFCIVVFIWLAGAIDESIDRSDLLEHKEEVQRFKENQQSKYGIESPEHESETLKKTKGGFTRTMTRVSCFSYLEATWLHKFRSVRAAAFASFFWSFSVFAATSWLPSAVHKHEDLLLELQIVSASVGETVVIDDKVVQPLKPLLKKNKTLKKVTTSAPQENDEEVDEDEIEGIELEEDAVVVTDSPVNDLKSAVLNMLGHGGDAAEEPAAAEDDEDSPDVAEILKLKKLGVLSEEEAGKALLKLLSSRRRLAASVDKGIVIKNKNKSAGLSKKTLKNVSTDTLKQVNSLGFNRYDDGAIELEDRQQIMIWAGMAIAALVAIGLYKYLSVEGGLSVKIGWGPAMILGTLVPACIFLYLAVDLGTSGAVTPKELDDQFSHYVNLIITAMVLCGLCLPALTATQNLIAPFKAGATYSVISSWGTMGDICGVMLTLLGPSICHELGIIYFEFVSWLITIALFMTFVSFCLIDFSMIPELCPLETDGSIPKRMKYLKPVENPEE